MPAILATSEKTSSALFLFFWPTALPVRNRMLPPLVIGIRMVNWPMLRMIDCAANWLTDIWLAINVKISRDQICQTPMMPEVKLMLIRGPKLLTVSFEKKCTSGTAGTSEVREHWATFRTILMKKYPNVDQQIPIQPQSNKYTKTNVRIMWNIVAKSDVITAYLTNFWAARNVNSDYAMKVKIMLGKTMLQYWMPISAISESMPAAV